MLYKLFLPHAQQLHMANLFTYITLRSGLALLLSLTISLFITPSIISFFKKVQKKGQPIRAEAPKTHLIKAGTPTMGGLIILASSIISSLIFADLSNIYIQLALLIFISFGLLGFIDDYQKVNKNNHLGISGKKKLIIQLIISLLIIILLNYQAGHELTNYLTFPFFKKILIDCGYFYSFLAIFIIIGSSNAVNLTDGLDGLAIGTSMIAITAFGLIAYLAGNFIYANYLQIIYIPRVGEVTVLCGSLIGSSLGFLWFNAKPAEIMMGDTGSLSLGAFIGFISIITKHELILTIIGGIFVIETLSVILQVAYFKISNGKKIFLMTPIHHHFEQKGWQESKIVIRFWILALIFALIGLSSLKLR